MLQLIPMTDAQFAAYLETAVKDYAQAHIEAGDCEPEEALVLAQADYDSLLPEGLGSPGQHLFSIHDEELGAVVGMIWYNLREKRGKKSAFIYDFVIAEAYRRKGMGMKTLELLEQALAGQGIARLSLNVMGYNLAARSLYEKYGFRITGMGMTKLIGPGS